MINEEEVLKVLKEKHGVLIGERSAEEALNELKRLLADINIPITGRCLTDGLKTTVELSAVEFFENSSGGDDTTQQWRHRF